MFRRFVCVVFLLGSFLPARANELVWKPWSQAAFAQAAKEHKFVLLDLEAVWCHWCHVMEHTTYADPEVVKLLESRYVLVKVDQDSRPDLSNRYEDYGWPATIVFAADGSEIVRRRGYITPREMKSLLQAIIDDPSPGPSVTKTIEPDPASSTDFGTARRAELVQRVLSGYDLEQGGWTRTHKFLDGDNLEFCLRAAQRGNAAASRIAEQMLALERQLIDPAWGGVYQYSAEGDWVHPHFEKIMAMQTENLRIYALASSQFQNNLDLQTAQAIRGYLKNFLTAPNGTFYTSQDADLVQGEHAADFFLLDDAHRRMRGIPRIDEHHYARENGWAIASVCILSDMTGDPSAVAQAERAANWMLANRRVDQGGFRHGGDLSKMFFLGDSLAMGKGFFALYQSTGDARWLHLASATIPFIAAHFGRGTEAGFASVADQDTTMSPERPQFDEAVNLVRFANLLFRATANPADRALAEKAAQWLFANTVIDSRGAYIGGALLAEEELRTEPVHITVVGPRNSVESRALFDAARKAPCLYKLVEWWDPANGAPPRGENLFPQLNHPAAYLCANGACSAPIFSAAALSKRLAKELASSR